MSIHIRKIKGRKYRIDFNRSVYNSKNNCAMINHCIQIQNTMKIIYYIAGSVCLPKVRCSPVTVILSLGAKWQRTYFHHHRLIILIHFVVVSVVIIVHRLLSILLVDGSVILLNRRYTYLLFEVFNRRCYWLAYLLDILDFLNNSKNGTHDSNNNCFRKPNYKNV